MAAQSDLIPTNILVPTTVAPGASLSVSWLLANQGTAAANSTSTTELRINQSSSSAVGTDLTGVSTAALAAGASVSQSATLTAPTTPGTYYVWVIADDFSNVTNQSNTSNDLQHSVAFTVAAPTQSDLIPTNILVPTTVAPGASLSVSWLLANQGTAAANSTSTTELRINQSSSSAVGTDLTGVSTAALAAGASVSQSATLTAPTTPGTYYVWVIADDFSNVTNQSNTSNDLQHSVAFTVAAPTQSDLIPTNILVPTTVAPGASLSVSWLLANQGTAAANSTSTTELRINQSSSSAVGTDLTGVSTAALAAGASVSQSATLTAPTTPGTYYVWVIADDFSNVTNQSNTSNDLQHSVAFTVAAPTQSDLIPTNILVPTTVAPGASLSVSWLLANQGTAAANSTSTTELRINQSSSSAVGTDLTGVSTAALAAGASVSQSATLTAPTTPGTYYVWVIADDFSNVTNQSNTSNDLQHSVAFTVAAPTQSDLIPTNILVPTTVAPGASLSVSWLLANQGTAAANSTSTTELRINQSSSSAVGTDLTGVSTAALAAGASVSQSATLTAPTTPGTYYVWVIADDFSNVTNQSNTSNDLQHSVAFTVTGGGGGSATQYGLDYRARINIGTDASPIWQYYNPASYNTNYGYTDPNAYINPTDITAATHSGVHYSFAMEYIGGTNSNGYLRPSDVTALEAAGLSIVSIYERSPLSIDYFTQANADADATNSVAAASALGQTAGSAIYFTVDYAAGSNADKNAINAYFEEIQKDFVAAGSPYNIGVYADGDVLNWISTDANLSSANKTFLWLAYAPGWPGSSGYSSETVQQDYSTPINIGPNNRAVDLDIAYNSNFGQWGGSTGGTPPTHVATNDFNGDSRSDILWRYGPTGAVFEAQMNGTSGSGWGQVGGDANWSVVGTGDFNGDGRSDILWRYAPTGAVFEAQMNGTSGSGWGQVGGDANWSVVGTGDFNGDGRTDILWRNASNGSVFEAQMNGTTGSGWGQVGGDANWSVVGTGDFNGDGRSDILWRYAPTGAVFEAQMNGTSGSGWGQVGGDANWSVVGTGDFNGDGRTDILWRNASNGSVFEAQMNGTTGSGWGQVGGDANWSVVGIGDFNGDGRSDILWRNASNGSVFEAQMNGTTGSGWGQVGGDANWRPLTV